MSQKLIHTSKEYTINKIHDNYFLVQSQSNNHQWYKIKKLLNSDVWTCTCLDFSNRIRKNTDEKRCKHILACQKMQNDLAHVDSFESFKTLVCPKCYSGKFKKTGFRILKNGDKVQRHTCQNCQHRFTLQKDGFRKMKNDPHIVVESLDMVFCGVSFRDIARHMSETRNLRISHTSIQKWFRKYMGIIRDYVDSIIPPSVGEVWSVDEMMLNVKKTKKTGKGFYDWLWSIIEPKTRFIISSEISKTRSIDDARKILSEGKKKSGSIPNYIITDALHSYDKAIYKEFGLSRVAHIKTKSLTKGFENRPIERYHNEIREKLKSRRGLGNDNSAQEYADAYRIFHNFVRPHGGLPNKQTPAEAIGIDITLGDNKILGLIEKSSEPEYRFAVQLGGRAEFVDIKNEKKAIRIVPKHWIEKRIWREINDILRLNRFAWFSSSTGGYWIRLKQTNIMDFL